MLQHSCTDLRTLKQIHACLVISSGHEPPFSIASKLISLYSQFYDLDSAVLIFRTLTKPTTHVWNLIIKAHLDLRLPEMAFSLYIRMRRRGIEHDHFTFPIINAVVSMLDDSFLFGEMVHCLAFQLGFQSDIYFCNSMISLYGKHGCFQEARLLFDEMSHTDLVSWTSMITGCISEGDVIGAFELFHEMRMEEIEPNSVTVMVMLRFCQYGLIAAKQFHGLVIKKGFLIDVSLQNSLLKIYANNTSSSVEAEILFKEIGSKDIVSRNIMISCFSWKGETAKAVDCYCEMLRELLLPTSETLTLLVSVFSEEGNIFQGQMIHCLAIKTSLCDRILMATLLEFYAKRGKLATSVQLFNESPPSIMTWRAMISGFILNGNFKEAIDLFEVMLSAGVEPVAETLTSLVVAYTSVGTLRLGKGVHGYLIRTRRRSLTDSEALCTSVLNMYIRCGSIDAARFCFDRMNVRDVVAWTSMVEGYGTHGMGFEALHVFGQMLEEGIEPNSVSFLSLLSACSHSGLVIEGCQVLCSMKRRFGIEPDLNHYTCVVDLLGRSGLLKEALSVIVKWVACPDSRIWGALAAASRVHGERNLGRHAAQKLLELEPENVGYQTLVSNVEASIQKWDEVEALRSGMKVRKLPGWSCVEAQGSIHGFVSGDRSHHRVADMYQILECLFK